MQPIETIEYKGYTIEIHYDPDAECPLDGDDGAVIWAVWERNSIFSSRKYRPFDEPDEARPYAEANGYDIFPLYKYEHGAVGYSVSGDSYPYNCPWDGGRAGYILIKRGEWGDKSWNVAKRFCETMTNWCNGWFTGFVVLDEDGEHLDSCWGFDDQKYCIEEAKSVADYHAKQREELPDKYQDVADAALDGSAF